MPTSFEAVSLNSKLIDLNASSFALPESFSDSRFTHIPVILSNFLLLTTLNLPTLSSRRDLHLAILAFKLKQRSAPDHLLSVSFGTRITPYLLRQSLSFNTLVPRTKLYLDSPIFKCTTIFDTLPHSILGTKSLQQFKAEAGKHLSTHCKFSAYSLFH